MPESFDNARQRALDFLLPDGSADLHGLIGHEETELAQLVLSVSDGAKRLREALKDVLDAGERARAGFPIESEEWYARRDYARIVLKDTE